MRYSVFIFTNKTVNNALDSYTYRTKGKKNQKPFDVIEHCEYLEFYLLDKACEVEITRAGEALNLDALTALFKKPFILQIKRKK